MRPAPPEPQQCPAPPTGWRLWFGLILFVLNEPMGYASLGLCAASSALPHSRLLFGLGLLSYALSWVMCFVGLRLIGRPGLDWLRFQLARLIRLPRLRDSRLAGR